MKLKRKLLHIQNLPQALGFATERGFCCLQLAACNLLSDAYVIPSVPQTGLGSFSLSYSGQTHVGWDPDDGMQIA